MFHVEHQIIRTDFNSQEADEIREVYESKRKYFEEYIDKLLWWNGKINLVSRDVSRETLRQHVEHSLVILKSNLFKSSREITDTGTGGGLPGIPLAIIHPEKSMVLNDVVTKKIMACKQIAAGLKLKNISTEPRSIGGVDIKKDGVIISKHAFKINDLLKMIQEKPWKGLVFLKGGEEVEQELAGIEEKLKIKIIGLEGGFQNLFYKGKAMIEITRMGQE